MRVNKIFDLDVYFKFSEFLRLKYLSIYLKQKIGSMLVNLMWSKKRTKKLKNKIAMLSASKNNNFANLETWLVNKECLNVKITALIGSKTTVFYFSVSSDITWHAKVIIYVCGKSFSLISHSFHSHF